MSKKGIFFGWLISLIVLILSIWWILGEFLFGFVGLTLVLIAFFFPSLLYGLMYLQLKNWEVIQSNIEEELGQFRIIKMWGGVADDGFSKNGEMLIFAIEDATSYFLSIKNRKVVEKTIANERIN